MLIPDLDLSSHHFKRLLDCFPPNCYHFLLRWSLVNFMMIFLLQKMLCFRCFYPFLFPSFFFFFIFLNQALKTPINIPRYVPSFQLNCKKYHIGTDFFILRTSNWPFLFALHNLSFILNWPFALHKSKRRYKCLLLLSKVGLFWILIFFYAKWVSSSSPNLILGSKTNSKSHKNIKKLHWEFIDIKVSRRGHWWSWFIHHLVIMLLRSGISRVYVPGERLLALDSLIFNTDCCMVYTQGGISRFTFYISTLFYDCNSLSPHKQSIIVSRILIFSFANTWYFLITFNLESFGGILLFKPIL